MTQSYSTDNQNEVAVPPQAIKARFEALSASLKTMAQDYQPAPSCKALMRARLSNLMPTEDLKKESERAYQHLSNHIKTLAKDNLPAPAGAPATESLSAKMAVVELMALNEVRPKLLSNDDHDNINKLLDAAPEHTKTLGTLKLARLNTFFHLDTVTRLAAPVDMIKNQRTDAPDIQVADWFLAAHKRLDGEIKINNSDTISDSFINLMARRNHVVLSQRLPDNPALCVIMFENLGKPFEKNLYHHACGLNNPSHAMTLLEHSKFGVMVNDELKDYDKNDFQNLIAVVLNDDNGALHIANLIEKSSKDDSINHLLDSVVDAHNQYYDLNSLDRILRQSSAHLSQEQIKRLSDRMIKNSDQQPIIKPLETLINIANDKGFDSQDLNQKINHTRAKMTAEIRGLNEPLIHYSGVVLNINNADEIAIREAVSLPHFQAMIDDSLSQYDREVDCSISTMNSGLDHHVSELLKNYFNLGDINALNSLFSKDIHQLPRNNGYNYAQILFEANKQSKILPKHDSRKSQILADVVGNDIWLTSDDQKIARLSDIRSSSDFMELAQNKRLKSVDLDNLGLDGKLDKMLTTAFNEAINHPNDNQKQKQLNELVGLPVTLLSSKITDGKNMSEMLQNNTNSALDNSDNAQQAESKTISQRLGILRRP